MSTDRVRHLLGVCLAVFAIGVLLVGSYSPSSSKLATIYVQGTEKQEVANQIRGLVKMLDGVQSVFVNEKTNLITFRYDSGVIDIPEIENRLAGLGLQTSQIKCIKLLNGDSQKNKNNLSSTRTNPASTSN